MKNIDKPEHNENVEDIVDTLIRIPIKNLEQTVKTIQESIKSRKDIFNATLSSLSKREFELKAHLWKMRYSLGGELTRKLTLETEFANIKSAIFSNRLSHFHDTLRLKEKLQLTQEKLEMEREKRKLVE